MLRGPPLIGFGAAIRAPLSASACSEYPYKTPSDPFRLARNVRRHDLIAASALCARFFFSVLPDLPACWRFLLPIGQAALSYTLPTRPRSRIRRDFVAKQQRFLFHIVFVVYMFVVVIYHSRDLGTLVLRFGGFGSRVCYYRMFFVRTVV